MRIGTNPNKDKEHKIDDYLHQIIVPVYIPNLEGFFSDSFKVFQYCLESLFRTTHKKTFITIVNNGCCKVVSEFIDDCFQQGKVHEVVHTVNIGKLNAILKGLVGNDFPLVTVSDSDVLFCSGWQEATMNVFNNFPKAGIVGLTPQIKTFDTMCGNVMSEKLFSSAMRFSEVINPAAMQNFYKSIGWEDDYNTDYLKYNLAIFNNNQQALVGCGHFVATYRKSLFNEVTSYIGYKLGGNSEGYLDVAHLKKGMWRLCTAENYAYHMGNISEDWMLEHIKMLTAPTTVLSGDFKVTDNLENVSKAEYFIKNKLFSKLFSNKFFRKQFYKMKGLPEAMISKY